MVIKFLFNALKKSRNKDILIVFVLAVLLSVMICRGYIFNPGYIFLAEQFQHYTVDQFLQWVYPIWNDKVQSIMFAKLPKFYLYFVLMKKYSCNYL